MKYQPGYPEIPRTHRVYQFWRAEPWCCHSYEALHVVVVRVVEDVAARQQAPHAVGDNVYFGSRVELLHAAHVVSQLYGVLAVVEAPIVREYEEVGRVGTLGLVVAACRRQPADVPTDVIGPVV